MHKDLGKPRDFISQKIREKAFVPGSPQYELASDLTKRSPTRENPKIYKISPSNILRTLEVIQKNAKFTPGVGKYENVHQDAKILGCYKFQEPKSAFTEDAIWKGQQTPHQYPQIPMETYKFRKTMQTKFYKPPAKEAHEPEKKNNSPSPTHYNIEKTFFNQSRYHKSI